MNESLITLLVAFGIVDILGFALYLVLKFKSNKRLKEVGHYGDRAEHLVQEYIHEHFPDAFLLNNLYFETEHGLTQIDHILICRQGLYILETKSHNGHITVHERNWTQEYNGKNISFHNPTKQNQVHLKALKKVLESDPKFSRYRIGCIVVFTSKSVTFSEHVRGVVKLNRLADFIRRNPQVRRTGGQAGSMRLDTMKRLKDTIVRASVKNKKRHRRHQNDIHHQYSEDA